MTLTTRKTLLLADDHQLMLAGLRAVLAQDFEIVGAVTNGRAAVAETKRLRPELVALDVGMPDLNGIEAARQILAELPETNIIFVTQQLDGQYVRAAFEAGARGYVAKHSAATELFAAAEAIAQGKYFVTPLANATEPERFALRAMRKNPAEFFGGKLTQRQREVLQLIAEGKVAKEISAALGISRKTVDFHRASIMEVLGLRTTAELTRYAVANGIVGGVHTPLGRRVEP